MSSLNSHQRCIRHRAVLQREVALRLRCRKLRCLRAEKPLWAGGSSDDVLTAGAPAALDEIYALIRQKALSIN